MYHRIFRSLGNYYKNYLKTCLRPAFVATALFGFSSSIYVKKRYNKIGCSEEPLQLYQIKEDKGPKIPYVVIGNGTAAYYAAISIVSSNPKARILIISPDKYLPYSFDTRSRSAFFHKHIKESLDSAEDLESKYAFPFFENAVPFDQLLIEDEGSKISYFINTMINEIDSDNKKVTLDGGDIIFYDKLIIANKMREEPHPILKSEVSEKIVTISNIDDYSNLISSLKKEPRNIAIVGNHAHAFSLGDSLNKLNKKNNVYILNEGPTILDIIPGYLKEKMLAFFERKNIHIKSCTINNVTVEDDQLEISFDDQTIKCDLVTVFNKKNIDDQFVLGKKCIGSKCPELDPRNGSRYFVDVDKLELDSQDIFVAGNNSLYKTEVAYTFNPNGFEFSYITGNMAGKKACGLKEKFTYLPFKICNISERVRFQLVGDCSADLETVGIWKETGKNIITSPGLVLFHRNELVVGMLLWNLPHKLDLADEVVTGNVKVDDSLEIAKWFLPRGDLKIEELSKILPIDEQSD